MRREPGPIEALIAEFIGSILLTFGGAAPAVAAVKAGANGGTVLLIAALSHGLMLFFIAATMGRVSGAHVNPAVTLSLAAIGKFSWSKVPGYVVAQLLGGFAAAWIARGFYNASIAPTPANGGVTGAQLFAAEAIGTAILVFGVVAAATDNRLSLPNGWAPFVIGISLLVGVLVAGGISNAGLNPQLAMGPYIFNLVANVKPTAGGIEWLGYTVGPIVGGVIAAFLYQYVSAAAGILGSPATKRR